MLVLDLIVKEQAAALHLADLIQDVPLELHLHRLDDVGRDAGGLDVDERPALEPENVRPAGDVDDRLPVRARLLGQPETLQRRRAQGRGCATHSRRDVQKTTSLPCGPAPIFSSARRRPSVEGMPVP